MPRSALERLHDYQSSLLKEIAAAAEAADSSNTLLVSDKLRTAATLIREHKDLDKRTLAFLNESNDPKSAVQESLRQHRNNNGKVPGRAHGADIRGAFLGRARSKGVTLHPYRGAIFTAPDGTKIGIAVATERQPNRWFLGLKDGGFDAAVLLCQGDDEKVMDICLPRTFIERHGKRLSRSGDQVKFNVVHRSSDIALIVPQTGPVRVDAFVNAIETLTK